LIAGIAQHRLGVSTQDPSLLIAGSSEFDLKGALIMAVTIKPLEDRIVVKANEAETTTASGLVIPDTAKEKPQEGTVVAVGPGRFDDGVRVPMDVKVGDVVLYSKYGGTEVKYNAEEYLVLSARDILAVIEKN
jgi:chaperonin GroES